MNSNNSANAYFDVALSQPTLSIRCRELAKLIDECSTKLLHNNLISIVHQIFGVNSPGWGILSSNARLQPADFTAMKDFLSSRGPIFRLLNKLQAESMLYRYEYPCSMLPPSFAYVPTDYSVRLTRTSQTLDSHYDPNVTSLNVGQPCVRVSAFEFYFYHFSYCIVRSPSSSQLMPITPYNYHQLPSLTDENLYFVLVDDYLSHFLSIDGSSIGPVQISSTVTTPEGLRASSFIYNARQSLLRKTSTKQPTHLGASRNEIWRSDLFIHILVEFWLGFYIPKNGDVVNMQTPSEDLVRAVRRLVKHIHYFCNATNPSLSHSSFNDTSLDVFKQAVIHNCLQPRLFNFLIFCFKVWPLNSTFRVVLETWLSYIQPWRYTDINNPPLQNEMRLHEDREIANMWFHFISSNLQFYTPLFYEALTRFLRMDISKQANSLLLYRVAKIFNQPNLFQMIDEAEVAMYGEKQMFPQSAGSFMATIPPKITFDSHPPCMITSEEVRKLINQLLIVCKQALGTVEKHVRPGTIDFSTQMLAFFGLGALADVSSDNLLQTNWAKSKQQIQDSMQLLAELFDLSIPELDSRALEGLQSDNPFGASAPECSLDEEGQIALSDLGRYELINNIKKMPVFPNTDPELQPIRSFENAFLVRKLHQLSTVINRKYENHFTRLCMQPNFVGRLSRYYLNHAYDYSPPVLAKPRQNIPPHVSLRVFAHYRSMFYIFMYFIICSLFDVDIFKTFFYAVIFSISFLVCRALCSNPS